SLTGAPSGACTLQVASGVSGQWTVSNACTGGNAAVTISSAGGGTTASGPGGVTTIVTVNSSGAFIAIPVSVYSLVQSDVPIGSAVSLTDTVSANVTSVS